MTQNQQELFASHKSILHQAKIGHKDCSYLDYGSEQDDINMIKEFANGKKMESCRIGGFYEPFEPLSSHQIDSLKDQIKTTSDKLELEIHHPYYRRILRNYANSLDKDTKSYTNRTYEIHQDSSLHVHYFCGHARPAGCLVWIHDGHSYIPEYYRVCSNTSCYRYIYKDRHGDEYRYDGNGYKVIRTTNCLVINPKSAPTEDWTCTHCKKVNPHKKRACVECKKRYD